MIQVKPRPGFRLFNHAPVGQQRNRFLRFAIIMQQNAVQRIIGIALANEHRHAIDR